MKLDTKLYYDILKLANEKGLSLQYFVELSCYIALETLAKGMTKERAETIFNRIKQADELESLIKKEVKK
jgi:hypothetical protein